MSSVIRMSRRIQRFDGCLCADDGMVFPAIGASVVNWYGVDGQLLHDPPAKAPVADRRRPGVSESRGVGARYPGTGLMDGKKRVPGFEKNAYLMLPVRARTRTHMATNSPTTIKKYANRRLYNTASSAYVTLADLAKMVKSGEDFVVYDAKTNEDITRSVLTQIIFEQEGIEGQSLLPTTFLRQLIRFYGDSMQALLPSYLEFSIDRFSGERQAMREAARMFSADAFSGGSFAALQELTQKNLNAFNQALGVFSPFPAPVTGVEAPGKKTTSSEDIEELRKQLSDIQRKLEALAGKS